MKANDTVAAIGSQLQVVDEVIFHTRYQRVSNVCVVFFFFKKTQTFRVYDPSSLV